MSKKLPTLEILEEDDEFEEFEDEWDQKESLTEEEKQEWEDDWDDVDIDDDFSAALRAELQKVA